MKLRAYIAALQAVLLASLIEVSPVHSGSMTLLGAGKASGAVVGCSQATTFLARTTGLNGTETTAYTNLICGLVTDGIYSNLDCLYIFATNSTTTANLNLINTSFTLTKNGTVTFTADHGYTGDGSTGYFDTGFNMLSNGVAFTQNSASIGVYSLTSRTASADTVSMGINSGAGNWVYQQLLVSSSFSSDVNGATFLGAANSNAQGLWITSRTSSSAVAVYKNGNTTPFTSSGVDTSSAVVSANMFILGYNTGGSAGKFSTDQTSAAFIGGGLSSANMALLASRLNAFMTALGINVY